MWADSSAWETWCYSICQLLDWIVKYFCSLKTSLTQVGTIMVLITPTGLNGPDQPHPWSLPCTPSPGPNIFSSFFFFKLCYNYAGFVFWLFPLRSLLLDELQSYLQILSPTVPDLPLWANLGFTQSTCSGYWWIWFTAPSSVFCCRTVPYWQGSACAVVAFGSLHLRKQHYLIYWLPGRLRQVIETCSVIFNLQAMLLEKEKKKSSKCAKSCVGEAFDWWWFWVWVEASEQPARSSFQLYDL